LAGAPFTSGALAKVALKSNITFLPEPVAVTLSILLPLAAVGTTLKMARFLWLTWPRSTAAGEEDAGPALGSRSADSGAGGLWAPWLFLVGAVLAGVWLLPGAWGWLPAKFTPQKLWLATWPLLVGAGLAVVAARLRHDFSGKLSRWLPAGDMGVFLEKLLTRLQPKVEPATRSEDHHDHPDDADEPAQVPSVHWNALAHHLAGLEERLRAWPVAGTALLVLLGLLLWSLTESTR
jgi:hypothetical protein